MFSYFNFLKNKQTNTKNILQNKGKKKLREDLPSHFGRCQMKPIPCPNQGCSAQPKRADMNSHITKECSFRMETCEFCNNNYCFKDKTDHFNDPALLGHHVLKMANTVWQISLFFCLNCLFLFSQNRNSLTIKKMHAKHTQKITININ